MVFRGSQSAVASGTEGVSPTLFSRTKICKFNLRGECTRGSACNFAHSMAQLRQQPDFAKTRFCIDYLRSGECPDGDECNFAHRDDELRPGTSPTKDATSVKRKEVQAALAQKARAEEQARLKDLNDAVKLQILHNQAAMAILFQNLRPSSKSSSRSSSSDAPVLETRQRQLDQTRKQPDTAEADFNKNDNNNKQNDNNKNDNNNNNSFSRQTTRDCGREEWNEMTESASEVGSPYASYGLQDQELGYQATYSFGLQDEERAAMLSVKNTFLHVTCPDEEKVVYASRVRARSAPPGN
ncbi:unnamed protein product [Polarella glacialis]|uniref:C3H1-type domain-containing protein n=1 Tax=Polarella glacialis TaxID=89957 RepID=A0A813GR40_POLGL|nr:unnamed protein product [Polarella glacialis]CAE8640706.1 unnamed protein product [Polarella glacialis]